MLTLRALALVAQYLLDCMQPTDVSVTLQLCLRSSWPALGPYSIEATNTRP